MDYAGVEGAPQVGNLGHGWRTRSGVDVRLIDGGNGTVTYVAADGETGVFTASGSGYTSPGEFKADLAHNGSSGWVLTNHDNGQKLYFNTAGYLTQTKDRNDNVQTYNLDAANHQTTIVSDRGATRIRTATFGYGSNGFVSKVTQNGTDSTSRSVSYGYDSSGNLTSITPPIGKMTLTYDGSHRLTSLAQVDTSTATGDAGITRIGYVSSTQTQVADSNTDPTQPVGSVPHTTYDLNADLRVTKVTDPAGNARSTSYTPYADVASATGAEGGTTTNTFGANNGESLTKSASATGASVSIAYANTPTQTNPTGNFQPSSSTDPQGNTSTYQYNGTGNKTSTTDANAAKAQVDYNSDGTVKTSTDPANGTNATTYGYDADKQLTTITPPTGNSLHAKTFTYDAYGRLKTATDGAGRTTTYAYDKDDRTKTISYRDATVAVTYTYDGNGNVTARTDGSGTSTYTYNPLNRRTFDHASGWGEDHYYGYDWVGNRTWLTDGRGETDYTFDARNLLTSMTTSGGTLYTFSYDKDGRRTQTLFATTSSGSTWAARTQNSYDKSGRLTRTTTATNSNPGSTVYDVGYCYAKTTSPCSTATGDDTGLLRSTTEYHRGSAVTTYSYDKGNRLTAATGASDSQTYRYDSNGNRSSVTTNGATTQTLGFNSANQITNSGYQYDWSGNEVTTPTDTNRVYSAAEIMTNATPGGTPTELAYAGPDQTELITSSSSANTTYFVYGLPNQYGQPALQSFHGSTGTNPTLCYYLELDPTGTPLGVQWVDPKSNAHHEYLYVHTGNGSVYTLIDTAGHSLTNTWAAWPYGDQRIPRTVTYPTGTDPAMWTLDYAGGVSTAGLTKFGKRWYDATTGRFTQQDSLNTIGDPGHGNRYAYAGCDPINYVDPTGLDFWANFMGAVTMGAVTWSCTTIVTGITGGIGAPAAVGCFLWGAAVGAAVTTGMENDGY